MKKFNRQTYMYILAGLSIIVACFAIFTIGATFLHSDNNVSLRMLKAMVRHRSFYPSTWNAANGEIYSFHNNYLAVFTAAIFSNKVFARTLASAVSLVGTCALLAIFTRKYLKNDSWTLAAPMLALFLCSANARDMVLYQGCYLSPMIALTFCFMLSYYMVIESGHSKKVLVANVLCIFLMALDGVRYFAEFLLPFLGTVFIILLIKRDKKIITRALLYIGAPCLIGFGGYQLISHTHNMNSSVANSINPDFNLETVTTFLQLAYTNILGIFGYGVGYSRIRNGMSTIAALLICIVFPILAIVFCKNEETRVKHFYIFGVLHNLEMLATVVLLQKMPQRYLLSTVYVAIVITAHFVYSNFLAKKNKLTYVMLAGFTVLTFWFGRSLIKSTDGWQEILASERNFANTLVERGIQKGYATYWNAYTHDTYADGKLEFGAVTFSTHKIINYYWLNDDAEFEDCGGKSCVVLTSDEVETFGNAVWKQGTGPSDVFEVEDVYTYDYFTDSYVKTNMMVYEFDYDIGPGFSNGVHDGRVDLDEMYFSSVGSADENKVQLIKGSRVFGPNTSINAGDYHVKIEGSGLNNCDYEISANDQSDAINYSEISRTDDYIELDMNVDELVYYIEIDVSNKTDSDAYLYDILVEAQ